MDKQFYMHDRVFFTGRKKVGTIVAISRYGSYGVEFDDYVILGHSLGGACEFGRGLWVSGHNLELADECSDDAKFEFDKKAFQSLF